MPQNLSRENIEKEVNEDLSKSDHQLLVDIHQEILRSDRLLPENAIHAMKRFSSLVTRSTIAANKSSEENIKLQKDIKTLTDRLLLFTVIMVLIGIIQIIIACSK